MSRNASRYASTEEVALAFAALGAADYIRLGRIAQLRARGLPELDWRDLLQEATHRSLEGARRWPLDVPFLVFLAETIRSIASEAWRQRARGRVATAEPMDGETANEAESVADDAPDPERALVARDLLIRLETLFAEDAAAKAVIDGLAAGLSPPEIQANAGLDVKTYESTRRRIRRVIARTDLESL